MKLYAVTFQTYAAFETGARRFFGTKAEADQFAGMLRENHKAIVEQYGFSHREDPTPVIEEIEFPATLSGLVALCNKQFTNLSGNGKEAVRLEISAAAVRKSLANEGHSPEEVAQIMLGICID